MSRLRSASEWAALRSVRVIVTRPDGRAQVLLDLLERAGAWTVHVPCASYARPASCDDLDRELPRSASFDWLLWTSVHAVDAVAERADAIGATAALQRGRHAAIGESTARALRDAGLDVHFVARGSARALADDLPACAGMRTLFPRSDIARRVLPDVLTARGVHVTEAVAYCTATGPTAGALRAMAGMARADLVTFCSPSSARGFIDAWESSPSLDGVEHPTVVCLGATSAATATAAGWPPATIAAAPTMEDLMDAMTRAVAT